MTENNDKAIQEVLKAVLPRVDPELPHDLWPAMLNRMRAAEFRFCWYDWALIAGLYGWALVYPQVILQLLYQF